MKRDKGTQLREIRDGISRTIMIVESKRQIPWTKPVDLEYKKDGKLPKLGGFHQGGFNVAICNGAVHFIAATIDETVLRGNDGSARNRPRVGSGFGRSFFGA